MTPTIVLKEGEPKLIVGTPGGSTIITSVFQTILNVLEFDMDLQAAVDAPKMHHQWQPDLIILEKNKFDENTISELKEKGHVIEFTDRLGIMNCIYIDENKKSQAVGDITRYTGFGSVIKNE
jgi:gamma-glutamyltranspeptidase/glutathione hydrolase